MPTQAQPHEYFWPPVRLDPKMWPQRNYDVGFDLAGGWEGDFAGEFGVQEWGGRTNDGARGYLA
ncbi:MAG: hypothetical protein WAK86_02410, partial [Pseudonocardiaceae bacterium]